MYSDPATEEKLMQMHEDFENSPYTAERIFTNSWIRDFYSNHNKFKDEESLITQLRTVSFFFKHLPKNLFSIIHKSKI